MIFRTLILVVLAIGFTGEFGFGVFSAGISIFALIIGLVLYRTHKKDQKRKKEQLEMLQKQEADQEAIPCRLCKVLPNAKDHNCVAGIEIITENLDGRERFIDIWLDSEDRQGRCSRIHRKELDANLCGRNRLRNFQTGTEIADFSYIERQPKAEVQTPRTKIEGLDDAAWFLMLVAHDFKCAYCGKSGDANFFHKDHKISLAQGGANNISNITPACPACNYDKGTRSDAEYMALRTSRLAYRDQDFSEPIPGNINWPRQEVLPKGVKKIPAPRGSVRKGDFYASWIRAMCALIASGEHNQVNAHCNADFQYSFEFISRKPNASKNAFFDFQARIENRSHRNDLRIYSTLNCFPKTSESLNRTYRWLYGVSINTHEVRALEVALDSQADCEIIDPQSGNRTGLVQVIKKQNHLHIEVNMFRLYRLP